MLCLLSRCTEGVEVIDTQVFGNSINSCPSDERREAAKIDARNAINDILLVNHIVPECGEGVWHQVGFLNMSNSEQSCPSPWVEDSSPVVHNLMGEEMIHIIMIQNHAGNDSTHTPIMLKGSL